MHGNLRPRGLKEKGSFNVIIVHLMHNAASTTMLILNDYSDFINICTNESGRIEFINKKLDH